jgi:hypothetical protein
MIMIDSSDAVAPLTIEKRQAQRRRVLKEGTTAFGLGIPCTVRDISDSGAALIVNNATDAPVEFVLTVVSCSPVRRYRMVWRRGGRLGAAFLLY